MSGTHESKPAAPALPVYPDLKSLCEAEMGPFEALYITPHLDEAGANPYLPLLYGPFRDEKPGRLRPLRSSQFLRPFLRRLLRGEKAIWHQHWLQFSSFPTFVRTNFRLLASALFAWTGGRILWTVHNDRPHGDRFVSLNQWYARRLEPLAWRLHIHNQETAPLLRELFGDVLPRAVVLDHPHIPAFPIPREEARRGLEDHYGIEARGRTVFLMFGAIARYKGIDEAIEAFAALPPGRALLIVAGMVRGAEAEYGPELRSRAEKVPGVVLLDRMIPEEHVNLFVCGSDRVVFNYRRNLNPSGMRLAADYGARMIAPDLETIAAFKGPDLETFDTPGELAALMRNAVAEGAS